MTKRYFTYNDKNGHYIVDVTGHVYGHGDSTREALDDALSIGVPFDEVSL